MVTIGFHPMFRFGACCQFNANAISLILENIQEIALTTSHPHSLPLIRNHLLCMTYRFSPKYTSAYQRSIAFFCQHCRAAPKFKPHYSNYAVLRLILHSHFRSPDPPSISLISSHHLTPANTRPYREKTRPSSTNPFNTILFSTVGTSPRLFTA